MRKLTSRFLVYFSILIAMLIFIVPLCYVVFTAFKLPEEFLSNPLGLIFSPTIENFVNSWQKANFGFYILNSLIYVTAATVLSLICSLLIAFPIARNYVRFSSGLYFFMMIGVFLPDGTIPLFQILLKTKLFNTRLGYIIAMLSIGGVALMFFVSYLKGIPTDLDEAAITDGCGYFTYFFKIIIPLSKPAISSMAILTAIGIWNDIVKAIIFLSDEKLFPITKGLFVFSGQYSTNWTELTAGLIIVALPLVVLFLYLQRYIIDGLTAGSVKM
ncbi:carbohydrate ABC transporter permease [Ruminiclostridium cellobioparum]|uniref:ABC-type sugar transport system, permease component n=1 Tax=Ruminiclostridium cellobioparum subsp. termitidis CT1112 TaxID=1195236 RepID=S0FLN4_RUMCE|nr:carbohydrate ABC transporter permease [Ruminiclostridium cellobioparum]EMS72812.1 ABC-type sugar transport system, permease component [Ruminiclostridium cellobioparum subsp. termitidis CT1112]